MSAEKRKPYDDYEICKDIAQAAFTTAQIAQKHGLSERMVRAIAKGDKRPGLKPIIDRLVDSAMSEARRVFRSRARWLAERLLHLAEDGNRPEVALKAICRGLELAGLTEEHPQQGENKKAIEIVLSSKPREGDPLKRRLTGVYRASNDN